MLGCVEARVDLVDVAELGVEGAGLKLLELARSDEGAVALDVAEGAVLVSVQDRVDRLLLLLGAGGCPVGNGLVHALLDGHGWEGGSPSSSRLRRRISSWTWWMVPPCQPISRMMERRK